jgi:hypothetical protein
MSKFLTLGLQDYLKGAIVAIGTGIITALQPILSSGQLPTLIQLKTCGIAALAAGVAYLAKNLFTNSNGQIAKSE